MTSPTVASPSRYRTSMIWRSRRVSLAPGGEVAEREVSVIGDVLGKQQSAAYLAPRTVSCQWCHSERSAEGAEARNRHRPERETGPSTGMSAIPRLRLRFARAPLGMTTAGDSSPPPPLVEKLGSDSLRND